MTLDALAPLLAALLMGAGLVLIVLGVAVVIGVVVAILRAPPR